MPQRKSTKGGYLSIINSKLRPQWGSLLLSEIRPAQVHTWLQHLDLAPVTKGHIKSLMHKLFDLATLWEYLPLERRNPIEIVKVKNVTMRTSAAERPHTPDSCPSLRQSVRCCTVALPS